MALSVIYAIVGLIVAWIILSIPVYLAARVISGKKATFGKAMLASLIAPVVELIFLFIFILVLTPFVGPVSIPVAIVISLILLIWVYASIFDTSWLGGLGIAIISVVISVIILAIFSAFFAILPFGTSIFHGGPRAGLLILPFILPA